MGKRDDNMWLVLLGVGALLALGVFSMRSRIIAILSRFIPEVEGFSATPYWDVTRYSWGYGTAAPGPTGTITKAKALADALAHLLRDYAELKPRITRSLSAHQWAALLSFAYNLGIGNALKIVDTINSGDDGRLYERWMSFVNVNGIPNAGIIERRRKEWGLWVS